MAGRGKAVRPKPGAPHIAVLCDVWVWSPPEYVEFTITLRGPIHLALVMKILLQARSELGVCTHTFAKCANVWGTRPGLDQQLVHNEQTTVQGQLNSLQQSNPDAYKTTISEINRALNPGTLGKEASSLFSTDKAFQGVLNGVRKDLGRDIDFSKQSDREAIGNALINHVRQTGGCDLNGTRQPGCVR